MSYEIFRQGLDAPICLTWEITYGCNLRCVHCLSSSGKRRKEELTTAEAKRLIDEWAKMKVFYINVGGGEPMSRRDFFELMDYALERGIGVKFSTNGTLIDDKAAAWIASRDYLDVQISVDGATAETNDPVRGEGSYGRARQAMERLARQGFTFKINATVTRENYPQLDALYAMAKGYGAELRLTRLRPTGRGGDVWEALARPMPRTAACIPGCWRILMYSPATRSSTFPPMVSRWMDSTCAAPDASFVVSIRWVKCTPVRSCLPRNFLAVTCVNLAVSRASGVTRRFLPICGNGKWAAAVKLAMPMINATGVASR
jgi:pyruvate-formate lyase-activating enzyme